MKTLFVTERELKGLLITVQQLQSDSSSHATPVCHEHWRVNAKKFFHDSLD